VRVLFLDIDGVLNSTPYLETLPKEKAIYAAGEIDWREMLDPANVQWLEKLVTVANAAVVISSSWRSEHKPEAIQGYIRDRGGPNVHVVGACPVGFDRGPSIIEWLKTWGNLVDQWVALDDCRDMGPAEHRTVRTSVHEGLTAAHVDRALLLLGLSAEGKVLWG
jgi:hypothetical protein